MNHIIAALSMLVFVCQASAQCRTDCRDVGDNCRSVRAFCEREDIKNTCMKTCGECTSCLVPRVNTQCEAVCGDRAGPIFCRIFRQRRGDVGCLVFGSSMCRATCGFCEGCRLPPSELECSNNCYDENSECPYWEDEGFCNTRRGFPHVQVVCPRSCGSCVPCETGKPNTALPPTQEEVEAAAEAIVEEAEAVTATQSSDVVQSQEAEPTQASESSQSEETTASVAEQNQFNAALQLIAAYRALRG